MIKQAIIPLAGLGTRLLPLTSVFAKELLPINGKPGLEYIIQECIDAGIKEVSAVVVSTEDVVRRITNADTTLDLRISSAKQSSRESCNCENACRSHTGGTMAGRDELSIHSIRFPHYKDPSPNI